MILVTCAYCNHSWTAPKGLVAYVCPNPKCGKVTYVDDDDDC